MNADTQLPLPPVGGVIPVDDKGCGLFEARVVATDEARRIVWLIPNETLAWQRFAAGTLSPWSFTA